MLVTPVSSSVYLSWMLLRSKRRIDYKIFHRDGKKVDKIMGDEIENQHLAELKARTDLEFSLDVYGDIEEYTAKSEVLEAITEISDQIKLYRHVHMDLKVELGDPGHSEKYPDFDANVLRALDFLKKARRHLKDCENDVKPVTVGHQNDQVEILQIEKETLDLKIAHLGNSIGYAFIYLRI